MRDRNAPLSPADIAALAWDKMGGLLPAIVQDSETGQVLMHPCAPSELHAPQEDVAHGST